LPIPSYAKVTNVNNGRSVIVRINDRGPFHSERLIDLSYGAAVKLGYMEQGTAPVEVELLAIAGVDDRRNIPLGSYRYLQLGAYADSVAAQNLRDTLAGMLGVPVSVSPVQSGEALLYRVRVGPVADPGQLSKLQKQLKNAGYSSVQALP
jgi:rare lipoprotein A